MQLPCKEEKKYICVLIGNLLRRNFCCISQQSICLNTLTDKKWNCFLQLQGHEQLIFRIHLNTRNGKRKISMRCSACYSECDTLSQTFSATLQHGKAFDFFVEDPRVGDATVQL